MNNDFNGSDLLSIDLYRLIRAKPAILKELPPFYSLFRSLLRQRQFLIPGAPAYSEDCYVLLYKQISKDGPDSVELRYCEDFLRELAEHFPGWRNQEYEFAELRRWHAYGCLKYLRNQGLAESDPQVVQAKQLALDMERAVPAHQPH